MRYLVIYRISRTICLIMFYPYVTSVFREPDGIVAIALPMQNASLKPIHVDGTRSGVTQQ